MSAAESGLNGMAEGKNSKLEFGAVPIKAEWGRLEREHEGGAVDAVN